MHTEKESVALEREDEQHGLKHPPNYILKVNKKFYEITNRCSYMQSILFHC